MTDLPSSCRILAYDIERNDTRADLCRHPSHLCLRNDSRHARHHPARVVGGVWVDAGAEWDDCVCAGSGADGCLGWSGPAAGQRRGQDRADSGPGIHCNCAVCAASVAGIQEHCAAAVSAGGGRRHRGDGRQCAGERREPGPSRLRAEPGESLFRAGRTGDALHLRQPVQTELGKALLYRRVADRDYAGRAGCGQNARAGRSRGLCAGRCRPGAGAAAAVHAGGTVVSLRFVRSGGVELAAAAPDCAGDSGVEGAEHSVAGICAGAAGGPGGGVADFDSRAGGDGDAGGFSGHGGDDVSDAADEEAGRGCGAGLYCRTGDGAGVSHHAGDGGVGVSSHDGDGDRVRHHLWMGGPGGELADHRSDCGGRPDAAEEGSASDSGVGGVDGGTEPGDHGGAAVEVPSGAKAHGFWVALRGAEAPRSFPTAMQWVVASGAKARGFWVALRGAEAPRSFPTAMQWVVASGAKARGFWVTLRGAEAHAPSQRRCSGGSSGAKAHVDSVALCGG